MDEGNLAQLEELDAVHNALVDLIAEGLTGDDLLRVWIERRVNPLQKRTHKIWQMSGVMDPNRMSTFPLLKESVCRRVKAIAQTKMTSNWTWGKEPYTREDQPPSVSIRTNFSDLLLSEACFNLSFVSQRDIPCWAIEDNDLPDRKSVV